MNKPQCPRIRKLKKKLKTVSKKEIIELSSEIGISDSECDILVEKFCFGSSNTKISIKFNMDESVASESINRNLQKIVFYLENMDRSLENYREVLNP